MDMGLGYFYSSHLNVRYSFNNKSLMASLLQYWVTHHTMVIILFNNAKRCGAELLLQFTPQHNIKEVYILSSSVEWHMQQIVSQYNIQAS